LHFLKQALHFSQTGIALFSNRHCTFLKQPLSFGIKLFQTGIALFSNRHYAFLKQALHFEELRPMRPKARETTQHGSPPGWLEENDPAEHRAAKPVIESKHQLRGMLADLQL
jgi:hypothetical protein